MNQPRALLALAWLLALAACGDDRDRPAEDDTADTTTDSSGDAAPDVGDDVGDSSEQADSSDVTDTAADTGTDTGTDTSADVEDDTADTDDTTAVTCDEVPRGTALPRLLLGDAHAVSATFGSAEAAFDGAGNLIEVDQAGSVYRVTPEGTRTLWVADAVESATGVGFLPTGELLIADPILGRLTAVYSDGQTRTIASDLNRPVGLEVSPDGSIYVSEATSASITQIDPSTGGQTRIARGLPFTPGPIALSGDGRELYLTDAGGGAVYVTTREGAAWSEVKLLAALPGATPPCEGARPGDDCDADGAAGECIEVAGSSMICRPLAPCERAEPGDACEPWPGQAGSCVPDGGGGYFCEAGNACTGREEGDACNEGGVAGVCRPTGGGGLYCEGVTFCSGQPAGSPCVEGALPGVCGDLPWGSWGCDTNPCRTRAEGDGCSLWAGMSGVCTLDDAGISCQEPLPCVGASPGDACVAFGQAGRCADDFAGSLTCQIEPPCTGSAAGDACEFSGDAGTCIDIDGGNLACDTNSCASALPGTPCTSGGTPGTCGTGLGARFVPIALYCVVTDPCLTANVGDACVGELGLPGTCADGLGGALVCQVRSSCSGVASEPCTDLQRNVLGQCELNADGQSYCALRNACLGATVGEVCSDLDGQPGLCADADTRLPYCRRPRPCDGLGEGDACTTPWGPPGFCSDTGFGLDCFERVNPCGLAAAGDACTTAEGQPGRCEDLGTGSLGCVSDVACNGLSEGDACIADGGGAGVCSLQDGLLVCARGQSCAGLAAGDTCFGTLGSFEGRCVELAGGSLACAPGNPCAGLGDGAVCRSRDGRTGSCISAETGESWCRLATGAGRITAIEADNCGNVYVADHDSRAIWRISGETVSPLAPTPSVPVTSLAWSGASAGFTAGSLFVSVRGGAEISALEPGVTPRRTVAPATTGVVPDRDEPTGAVDCRRVPSAPTAAEELTGPVGYHDVAFDDLGFMIGTDLASLIAVDINGQVQLFAPNVSGAQGMDWLADGTLVVNSGEGVIALAPSGARRVLAANIYGYGLTVGPDNLVYTADNANVYRIEPDSGVTTTYLEPAAFGQSWGARNIEFSPDLDVMYIGSFGDWIYAVTLDENLDPVGPPREYARIRSGIRYQDGLGTDACGNLFVPNYESSALYRVTPDAVTHLYHQFEFTDYGHGLEWGRGIGGWSTNSLYLPQPYDGNTVIELRIGVPARRD